MVGYYKLGQYVITICDRLDIPQKRQLPLHFSTVITIYEQARSDCTPCLLPAPRDAIKRQRQAKIEHPNTHCLAKIENIFCLCYTFLKLVPLALRLCTH